jgi:hypothetical protein
VELVVVAEKVDWFGSWGVGCEEKTARWSNGLADGEPEKPIVDVETV